MAARLEVSPDSTRKTICWPSGEKEAARYTPGRLSFVATTFATRLHGNRHLMLVAGVDLPFSAVALALCLSRAGEHDLATRVGLAVDTNRDSLTFNQARANPNPASLEDCPTALLPLRDALGA